MSLLALYSNIIWRGNGPGQVLRREVAAILISRRNEPQPLHDLSGLASAMRHADGEHLVAALQRILAADPCFRLMDGSNVCLDIQQMLSDAKSRLVEWVDLVFPSQANPALYLKNCMAKYIISEQGSNINSSPSTLFTLGLASAETMLDVYWTNDHPWRGTVSPAHHSTEALFLGDSLWAVQPGTSIKLNMASLMQRAASVQPDLAQESGDIGAGVGHVSVAAAGTSAVGPLHPLPDAGAVSAWTGGGDHAHDDQSQVSDGPSLGLLGPRASSPPPPALPSAALFAAAAPNPGPVTHPAAEPGGSGGSGRDSGGGIQDVPVTAPASEPAAAPIPVPIPVTIAATGYLGTGPGDVSSNHLDQNLDAGASLRLSHGLGLRWPHRDHSAGSTAPLPATFEAAISRGGTVGGFGGGHTTRHGVHGQQQGGLLVNPVEAAVEEVAEHVALEALGDDPGRSRTLGGNSDARVGSVAGGDSLSTFAGARGWELFPSAGPGQGAGRGRDGGMGMGVGAGGGGGGGGGLVGTPGWGGPVGHAAATGSGNMSLLEELYMTFVPGGPTTNVKSVSGAESRSTTIGGAADLTHNGPLARRGSDPWGGGWSKGNDGAADSLQRGAAAGTDTKPSGGGGLLPSSSLMLGFDLHSGSSAVSSNTVAGAGYAPRSHDALASAGHAAPWMDSAVLNVVTSSRPELAVGGMGLRFGQEAVARDASGGGGGRGGEHPRPDPRVVPCGPPPPPLALARPGFMVQPAAAGGADDGGGGGPHLHGVAMPSASLQGFNVAAAAAAAAGRGLGVAQLPAALGSAPGTLASGAAAAPGGGAAPQLQAQHHVGAGSSGHGVFSAAVEGLDGEGTTHGFAASAARVWTDDSPQSTVRRIAATLLAHSGSAGALGPHSMALELLLLAVRRQDPVACNRAGNLLAVLEKDPCRCLSVVEDMGANAGEVAVLDMERMMALAGPPLAPPHPSLAAPVAAPSNKGDPPHHPPGSVPASLHPENFPQPAEAVVVASAAQLLARNAQPPPPGASFAWPSSAAAAGVSPPASAATAGSLKWPPRSSHGSAGPVPSSITAAISAAPVPLQQGQPAYAAAAAAAAAMQAYQAAQSQVPPQSATAPGTNNAVMLQLLQQQPAAQSLQGLQPNPMAAVGTGLPPHLAGAAAGLSGGGVQDRAMLLQMLQAQQQQTQQLQHAQQLQQIQLLLHRQSAVAAAQQQQQLLHKQHLAQQQQLQQQMALLRQHQQAQAQLAPRLPVIPVPATAQTNPLASLLQQYNANSAAAAAAAAAARVASAGNPLVAALGVGTPVAGAVSAAPLTLAALSTSGGLPTGAGPVAQSQSHANVAAWLAAHAHNPGQAAATVANSLHGALGGAGATERGLSALEQQQLLLAAAALRESDPQLGPHHPQPLFDLLARRLQQLQQAQQAQQADGASGSHHRDQHHHHHHHNHVHPQPDQREAPAAEEQAATRAAEGQVAGDQVLVLGVGVAVEAAHVTLAPQAGETARNDGSQSEDLSAKAACQAQDTEGPALGLPAALRETAAALDEPQEEDHTRVDDGGGGGECAPCDALRGALASLATEVQGGSVETIVEASQHVRVHSLGDGSAPEAPVAAETETAEVEVVEAKVEGVEGAIAETRDAANAGSEDEGWPVPDPVSALMRAPLRIPVPVPVPDEPTATTATANDSLAVAVAADATLGSSCDTSAVQAAGAPAKSSSGVDWEVEGAAAVGRALGVAAASAPAPQHQHQQPEGQRGDGTPYAPAAVAAAATNAAVRRLQHLYSTPTVTTISPAHLLAAFPGLDTRAQALRTLAQVLLHSRHPQLGAAAAEPGLLVLVLRQKGILGPITDSEAMPLLMALLMGGPRFFRIVPVAAAPGAEPDGEPEAGTEETTLAVQLKVDELVALIPLHADVAGGSPAAADGDAVEQAGITGTHAAAALMTAAVVSTDDDADGTVAGTALEAAGVGAVAAAVAMEAVAPGSLPERAATISCENSKGGGAGSPDAEGEGEGEEEQSDEAHLAMLMQLLATGAKLEEEPLPDSVDKLQRQLSPLLGLPDARTSVKASAAGAAAAPLDVGEKAAAAADAPMDISASQEEEATREEVLTDGASGAPAAAQVPEAEAGDGSPARATDVADTAGAAVTEPLPTAEPPLDSRPDEPANALPAASEPQQMQLVSAVSEPTDVVAAATVEPEAATVEPEAATATGIGSDRGALSGQEVSASAAAHGSGWGPESAGSLVEAGATIAEGTQHVVEKPHEGVAPSVPAAPGVEQATAAGAFAGPAAALPTAEITDSPQPGDGAVPETVAAGVLAGFTVATMGTTCTAGPTAAGDEDADAAAGASGPTAEDPSDVAAATLEAVDVDAPSASAAVEGVTRDEDVAGASQRSQPPLRAAVVVEAEAAAKVEAETAIAAAAAAVAGEEQSLGFAAATAAADTHPPAQPAVEAPVADEKDDDKALEPSASNPRSGSGSEPRSGRSAEAHSQQPSARAQPADLDGSVGSILTAATSAAPTPTTGLPRSGLAPSAPTAAHLQPAVVRYISAADVETGAPEEVAALAAMEQHCTAVGRVVVDCAVADAEPAEEAEGEGEAAAAVEAEDGSGSGSGGDGEAAAAEDLKAGATRVSTRDEVRLAGEGTAAERICTRVPQPTAAAPPAGSVEAASAPPLQNQAAGRAPPSSSGGRRSVLVLLTVLAPAAQSWPTTLYVLGVSGMGPDNALSGIAASLLAGAPAGAVAVSSSGAPGGGARVECNVGGLPESLPAGVSAAAGTVGGVVKIVWNARQVLPALAPLLPPGARLGPVQDLHTLVSLLPAADGPDAAATSGLGGTGTGARAAAGVGLRRQARPWFNMVPLQERLAQLGVSGCDLASLAALGTEAWVVHPLSCVVEAAAARQLCQVLEVRRALLFSDESLLDALLCSVCDRVLST